MLVVAAQQKEKAAVHHAVAATVLVCLAQTIVNVKVDLHVLVMSLIKDIFETTVKWTMMIIVMVETLISS